MTGRQPKGSGVAGSRVPGRRAWGHINPALVVILAGVSAALHLAKLFPALPVVSQAFDLSLVQAGFLLSAVQVAGMTLGLAAGLAADAVGLKRSMICGLLLLFIAVALVEYAQSASILIATRIFEGIGFLLVCTPGPGLIRRLVPPDRLGATLGLWGAYMPFATALALLGGPGVILLVGWQGLWWGLSLQSLLLAGWVWRVVPPDPSRSQTAHATSTVFPAIATTIGTTVSATLTRPGPWLVALCFAVYSGQWLAVIGFLPTVYAQAGVGVGATAALTALAAGVNMLGNIVAGRMLGRGVRAQRLLSVGFGVMAASACVAYVVFDSYNPPAALRYGAIVLFSMVGGLIPGTLFSVAVRVAPGPQAVSTTVGFMQQWSALGQFGGPPLVAWVASRAGSWQWTWVVTGFCSLLGLGLSWLLGKQVQTLTARENQGLNKGANGRVNGGVHHG